MIHAHQDKEFDLKVGVKSTVILSFKLKGNRVRRQNLIKLPIPTTNFQVYTYSTFNLISTCLSPDLVLIPLIK
ncbi:uncharacterized protein MELLADRAFT_55485 [Melampsora larici-populina 98AG31]|uniref:Uncharacterized protein n=1 Tax=Melampsora larici-populina (strain 98AG31 / pathotype 3-4-7) TaxID=747676 RepID=F4RFF5_MELLP|nr:uncharacterized protein MELLADRAFT_55485 [Melampsora larici-populina 98AG31]EGG08799.1 hypothetical protein MELLADRAFT_55485 [Melampsora larici-populina 98AG31]